MTETFTPRFTPEDVLRVTKELLAEYGEDYRYEKPVGLFGTDSPDGCFYAVPQVELEESKFEGERPQVVGCTPGTTPSCIVGHIAYRLDPELFESLALSDADAGYGKQPEDTPYAYMSPPRKVRLAMTGLEKNDKRYDFVDAIFDMQAAQDRGEPWGEAAKRIFNYKEVTW